MENKDQLVFQVHEDHQDSQVKRETLETWVLQDHKDHLELAYQVHRVLLVSLEKLDILDEMALRVEEETEVKRVNLVSVAVDQELGQVQYQEPDQDHANLTILACRELLE